MTKALVRLADAQAGTVSAANGIPVDVLNGMIDAAIDRGIARRQADDRAEARRQHEADVAEMRRITGTPEGQAPPAWY